MTAHTSELSPELLCDRCGYDLRAHPEDGVCPECGASVAEARRMAANPRRPVWAKSDPRWRRRILAGCWILVLLPLLNLLTATGWPSHVAMPNIFRLPGTYQLDETFLFHNFVYSPLVFCIGVVQLFSNERGRRHNKLDWTRRWGVICSYIVFLLSVVTVLYICTLVSIGIGANFLTMPPRNQPGVTQFFIEIGYAYLRYGPYPKQIAYAVLAAFSSITILLACVPLFNALHSTVAKRFAIIPIAPLALFALMHFAQAAQACLTFSSGNPGPSWMLWALPSDINHYDWFFWPEVLVGKIFGFPAYSPLSTATLGQFSIEFAKWTDVLAIAIWLSIAQFAASRRRKKTPADITPLAAGTV